MSSMKKTGRILAWTLGLGLSLIVLLLLAVRAYFTPERVRALIMEYAGKNLKREIVLGSAYLGPRGIYIKDLKVAEAGGFSKGQFMSAREFSVRPDFGALLRKELKIRSIRADGLTLSVLQVNKETYNLSDLLPAAGEEKRKPAPAPGRGKPIGLSVSDITVKNARIVYSSADRSMSVTLSGLDLSVRSLTAGDLFPFRTEFTLELKSPYLNGEFPVLAEGRLALGGWDPRKGRAEIERAVLQAGKIVCELKGGLTDLIEPDAELSLRVKAFSSSELRPYFPQVPPRLLLPALEADSSLKLTSGKVSFRKLDFRAGPARGSISGRVAWDPAFDYSLKADVRAQVPELDTKDVAKKFRSVPKGIKVPLTDITARLALSPARTRVLSADISAKSLKVSASGEFSGTPPFSMSGGLKFTAGDLRDIAAIYPQLKAYAPSGAVSGSAEASFTRKGLSARGKAAFSDVGAEASGSSLTGLNGSAEFSGTHVKAEAAGKLDGAPLKISVGVRNYLSHPLVTLNTDLETLKVKASPPESAKQDSPAPAAGKARPAGKQTAFDISGRTRFGSIIHPNLTAGETVLTYDMKNVSADPSKLSGSAAFRVNGGKFEDLYALAKRNKAAKIALYPLIALGKASKAAKALKLPDFNTIAFSGMEGDYVFHNGAMKVQRSSLTSDLADADMSGGIDLASEALDLRITARLKETGVLSLPAPIGMTVKGTFDEPSVKPDVKSIIGQPAVKDKVEKLLRKLIK